MLHSFLIRGKIGSMENIVDLPHVRELELIRHMAQYIDDFEWSVSFGS
jgi:hypothetical protein